MFNLLKKLFSKEKNNTKNETHTPNFGFEMSNNEATIWEGNISDVSFSHYGDNDKKQRISGIINRIYLHGKGDFFISIDTDIGRLDINENYICTLIQHKSSRYKLAEFFIDVLHLDNKSIFEYAKYIRNIANTPKIVKQIEPIKTEFTYIYTKNDEKIREKHNIFIDQYLINAHGFESISGLNVSNNERLYFSKSKINTMLNSEGHKKYRFDEWLIHVFGINNDDNK